MSGSLLNVSARFVSAAVAARRVRLLAALCLVLAAAGAARATSYTYVGAAAAGQQNDWSNSKNWSPNGVPGQNDDATIDSSSTSVFPSVNTSGITVNNLTLKGNGSITDGNVTVKGTLTMSSGRFFNSKVTAQGGMEISSLGGFGDAQLNSTRLQNNGTARMASGGLALLHASFINSGTFNIGGGARIIRQDPTDGSTFINQNIFRSDPNQIGNDAGSLIATNKVNPLLINDVGGTVDIEDGTLTISAPADNYGVLKTNSSASQDSTIRVAGDGVLFLNGGSSLTGTGVFEVNGECQFYGKVTAVRFRLATVSGMPEARLAGQGTSGGDMLTVSDTFEWQGGVINSRVPGALSFSVEVAGKMNISSGNNVLDHADLINNGTVNMSSGAMITTMVGNIFNRGIFNMVGAKFIESGGGISIFRNGEVGILRNTGGQTDFGIVLTVDGGGVEVQQGTLNLTGKVSSSIPFTAAANTTVIFANDVKFDSGARLEGAGLFRATGSGTIRVNADVPAVRFEYNGSSKTFSGPGHLNVSSLFDWKAGNMNCTADGNTGGVVIQSGATLLISGDTSKTDSGCGIDNGGTANFTPSARLTLNEGANWNNLTGGTLNLNSPTNQGFFYESGALPVFNNSGTVNVSGGSTSPIFMFPGYTQTGGETHVEANKTFDLFKGGAPSRAGSSSATTTRRCSRRRAFPSSFRAGR